MSEIVTLENKKHINFKNKILMIPQADPGYDWIFNKQILGFVTMYGGSNSHMAIRAAELGVPAVIGVGSKNYEKLLLNKFIEIDFEKKIIKGVIL